MKFKLLPTGKRTQAGVYAMLMAEDGSILGPLWIPKEKIGPGGISCELKTEKSCGAVIFREKGREKRWLLLHYKPRNSSKIAWWDFVKGHVEDGETERDTVVREIKEETGLDKENVEFVSDFKAVSRYHHFFNGFLMHKEVIYYLVKAATEKIQIDLTEHLDYVWLPYEEALDKITYENSKQVLKKAEEFLNSKVAPAASQPEKKKEWGF